MRESLPLGTGDQALPRMTMSEQATPRCAAVRQLGDLAGYLTEGPGGGWAFAYLDDYAGPPISLTMPVRPEAYEFAALPPALEGLLPEGPQLESLLKTHKIDRSHLPEFKKNSYHDLLTERSERLEIGPGNS